MYSVEEVVAVPSQFHENLKRAEQCIENGDFQLAIQYCDICQNMRKNDRRVLCMRGRCHFTTGLYDKAEVDADTVLSIDNTYMLAILLKADTLFEIKNYPEAMKFYKKGIKLRPDVINFYRGVDFTHRNMKYNAIGRNIPGKQIETLGGYSLRETQSFDNFMKGFGIIKNTEETTPIQIKKNKSRIENYRKDLAKRMSLPCRIANTKSAKLNKGIVDTMFYGNRSSNKNDSLAIKDIRSGEDNNEDDITKDVRPEHVLDANKLVHVFNDLKFTCPEDESVVAELEEFIQKRNHAFNKEDSKTRKMWKINNEMSNDLDNSKFIDCFIWRILLFIDAELERRHPKVCRKYLIKTIGLIDSYGGVLENKFWHHSELSLRIANSYAIDMNEDKVISNLKRTLMFSRAGDCEIVKMKALDQMAEVCKNKKTIDDTILIWMEQYKLASSTQEKLWLYHEIGNCYLDAERHDDALEWALQLHLLSLEEQDQTWSVYAVVLMAKTEESRGYLNKARNHYENAINIARCMRNKKLEAALTVAQTHLDRRSTMVETTYVRPYILALDQQPITEALTYQPVDYVDAWGDVHLSQQVTSDAIEGSNGQRQPSDGDRSGQNIDTGTAIARMKPSESRLSSRKKRKHQRRRTTTSTASVASSSSSLSNHRADIVKALTGEEEYERRENQRTQINRIVEMEGSAESRPLSEEGGYRRQTCRNSSPSVDGGELEQYCDNQLSEAKADYSNHVMKVNTMMPPNPSRGKVQKVLDTFSTVSTRNPSGTNGRKSMVDENQMKTSVDLISLCRELNINEEEINEYGLERYGKML